MEDKEYELINKMVVKINEARSYHRISTVLTLIWLFEICYSFFWIKNFGVMYFLIWAVCLIGWISVDRKYKDAMNEYDELKEEYNTRYEDNF